LKWYRKAAEQNFAQAQYDLGLCYANGEGVAKNHVEAYKWWTLSANQTNADAKKYLSVLEGSMSPDQIREGQKLVRNFRAQKTPTGWTD
jgi:TPR repeat protein